jgi:hypothetical protein
MIDADGRCKATRCHLRTSRRIVRELIVDLFDLDALPLLALSKWSEVSLVAGRIDMRRTRRGAVVGS